MSDQPCLNTDRELWREREGDYYADSIHVTQDGAIGINTGGLVVVKTLRAWVELAKKEILSEDPNAFLPPQVNPTSSNASLLPVKEEGKVERVLLNALVNADKALKICYADSHFIRPEWLRENGHEGIADVINNIRKWSGAHHNEILTALRLSSHSNANQPALPVTQNPSSTVTPSETEEEQCPHCGSKDVRSGRSADKPETTASW